jgi:Protein of unknown function (DUF2380)
VQAWGIVLPVWMVLVGPASALAATPTAVVFPFAFIDTSPEPPRADELARLHDAGEELRRLLDQSQRYVVIATASVEGKATGTDFVNCQPCAVAAAKDLGADVAVIGWVQKVSNLILNINAVMRSTATGDIVSAGSVDIRGNTDESWTRGVRYLAANRLLASPR